MFLSISHPNTSLESQSLRSLRFCRFSGHNIQERLTKIDVKASISAERNIYKEWQANILIKNYISCSFSNKFHSKSLNSHPGTNNLCKYYDLFRAYGDLEGIALEIEYCNTSNLSDLLRKRKINSKLQQQVYSKLTPNCSIIYNNYITDWECRYFIKQVLLAVDFLHRCKILHRDIKTDNCFLHECNGSLILKLGDFGLTVDTSGDDPVKFKKIVKNTGANTNRPMTRSAAASTAALAVIDEDPTDSNPTNHQTQRQFYSVVGTPGYMCPEIIQSRVNKQLGKTRDPYGTVCDIWAIGVLFHTMFIGYGPFYVKTTDEYQNIRMGKEQHRNLIYEKTLKQERIKVKEYFKNFHGEAMKFIDCCLRTQDDERRMRAKDLLKLPYMSSSNLVSSPSSVSSEHYFFIPNTLSNIALTTEPYVGLNKSLYKNYIDRKYQNFNALQMVIKILKNEKQISISSSTSSSSVSSISSYSSYENFDIKRPDLTVKYFISYWCLGLEKWGLGYRISDYFNGFSFNGKYSRKFKDFFWLDAIDDKPEKVYFWSEKLGRYKLFNPNQPIEGMSDKQFEHYVDFVGNYLKNKVPFYKNNKEKFSHFGYTRSTGNILPFEIANYPRVTKFVIHQEPVATTNNENMNTNERLEPIAAGLLLSDGTFQYNLIESHHKICLCPKLGSFVHFEPNGEVHTWHLDSMVVSESLSVILGPVCEFLMKEFFELETAVEDDNCMVID